MCETKFCVMPGCIWEFGRLGFIEYNIAASANLPDITQLFNPY